MQNRSQEINYSFSSLSDLVVYFYGWILMVNHKYGPGCRVPGHRYDCSDERLSDVELGYFCACFDDVDTFVNGY